jgi:hypothetical protein
LASSLNLFKNAQSTFGDPAANLDAVHGVVILRFAQNELVIYIIAIFSNELARSEELGTERTDFSGFGRHS